MQPDRPESALPPERCAPHQSGVEALVAKGTGVAAADGALAAHLASCATCAAAVERARARTRLLSTLERRGAPRGLDALVAAEVARRPVERALAGLQRHGAPAVLERLVVEEIAAPEVAVARRALHGLPRAPAPVRGLPQLARGPQRRRTHRIVGGIGLFAAAALVVWLGGPAIAPGPEPHGDATRANRERSQPRFRLVVVNSVDELDPLARGFAEGLAGRPLGRSGR